MPTLVRDNMGRLGDLFAFDERKRHLWCFRIMEKRAKSSFTETLTRDCWSLRNLWSRTIPKVNGKMEVNQLKLAHRMQFQICVFRQTGGEPLRMNKIHCTTTSGALYYNSECQMLFTKYGKQLDFLLLLPFVIYQSVGIDNNTINRVNYIKSDVKVNSPEGQNESLLITLSAERLSHPANVFVGRCKPDNTPVKDFQAKRWKNRSNGLNARSVLHLRQRWVGLFLCWSP